MARGVNAGRGLRVDAVACTSRDATGAGSMASRAARLRLDAAARETEYAEYAESAETCRAGDRVRGIHGERRNVSRARPRLGARIRIGRTGAWLE